MKKEKIKGYYRMENEIILELNKVAANNELFYNSIVQAAIGIAMIPVVIYADKIAFYLHKFI